MSKTLIVNHEGKDYTVTYNVRDEYIDVDVEGVKHGYTTCRLIKGNEEGVVKSEAVCTIKSNLPGGWLYGK